MLPNIRKTGGIKYIKGKIINRAMAPDTVHIKQVQVEEARAQGWPIVFWKIR